MIVSVGASGAVFGLMGAIGIIVLFTKNEKYMLFGPFAYAILSYAVGIDVIAHIGGLIGGIAISLLYTKQIKARKDSLVQIIDDVKNL